MDAKEYLKQVKILDVRIANKLIEKQQWHDLALSITANMDGERVQSSGSKSKMAEALDRCVDMESEIASQVDKLVAIKTEVTQTIERLDSATEYDVLHIRYIQHKSLQDAADKYKKDYGWVTTCHGRALKHVQELLDAK